MKCRFDLAKARDSKFSVFESWWEIAKRAKNERERASFFTMLCEFSFEGKEPKPSHRYYETFLAIKNNLVNTIISVENGRIGGLKGKGVSRNKGNKNAAKSKLKSVGAIDLNEPEINRGIKSGKVWYGKVGVCDTHTAHTRDSVFTVGNRVLNELDEAIRDDFLDHFFRSMEAAGWRDCENRPVKNLGKAIAAWWDREAKPYRLHGPAPSQASKPPTWSDHDVALCAERGCRNMIDGKCQRGMTPPASRDICPEKCAGFESGKGEVVAA